MLLSTARTLLKRYGFDDEDPLGDWLQAGLEEFAAAYDWPFFAGQASITIPANDVNGTPLGVTDFQKTVGVVDTTNEGKLKFAEFSRFNREFQPLDTTGTPEWYTVFEELITEDGEAKATIFVFPSPLVATSLTVYYRKIAGIFPLDLDGTYHLPVPESCAYAVVTASAFIALQAENEEERAQTAQAQFLTRVSNLINRYNPDHQDEPGQVVDVMGYQ